LYANKSTPTIVVKNVTVNGGSYGFNWNYGTKATLENVVMIDVKYGIHTRIYGAKTITVKDCTINAQYPIYVDQRSEAINTFNFEGENTLANLSTSEYAKYVLAYASAKLYATNSDLNITTSVDNSVVKYEDGAYIVKGAVAKIGNTYYATLAEALAADGNVVTLLVPFVVNAGETVVLDLNGKTLVQSVECTASYEMILNKGTLTIKNGTVRFTDTSADTPFSCIVIPYRRSAAVIVPLLCVIIINCVFFVNL
jgi:hypothetical protein